MGSKLLYLSSTETGAIIPKSRILFALTKKFSIQFFSKTTSGFKIKAKSVFTLDSARLFPPE